MSAGLGSGHVVVEGDSDLLDAVRRALAPGQRCEVQVSDETSASAALLAAVEGQRVLVHGAAPRALIDVLVDDLRRLAHVDVVTDRSALPVVAAPLPEGADDLLALLAEGRTLGQAASAMSLSRRTADRRLAAVRDALGARSTAEALALWSGRRRA